jgi:acyl dehydratase
MRLLVESGIPFAGGVIGAGGSIKWPRPTYAGDTIMVRGHIAEITPSEKRPDRGMVLVSTETVNQKGEVVQVMTATLIVPRRA